MGGKVLLKPTSLITVRLIGFKPKFYERNGAHFKNGVGKGKIQSVRVMPKSLLVRWNGGRCRFESISGGVAPFVFH